MTNKELHAVVKKLMARVETLEAELANASEPVEVEPERPAPVMTDYERRKMEYEERIRPEVEKWEAKLEAELQVRLEEFPKKMGYHAQSRDIAELRSHLEDEIPYTGSPRDYDHYLAAQRNLHARRSAEEWQKESTAGLEPGLFKDAMGIVRRARDGRPEKSEHHD